MKIKLLVTKVKDLFNALYVGYRFKLILLSIVGIFSGFIEGLGVALVVPLFAYLMHSDVAGSNFVVNGIEKLSTMTGVVFGFKFLLILTGVLFVGKAVLLYFYWRMKTRIVANYKISIRKKIYQRLLSSSYSFLRRQKLGYMDYLLITDVEAGAKMLENLILIILSVSTLLMYVVVSFSLSPAITLVSLVIGIAVMVVFKPLNSKLRSLSQKMSAVDKKISHSISEAISGIKAVKAFAAEDAVFRDVSVLFNKREVAETNKQDLKSLMKVSIEPLMIIFIVIIFTISYKFLIFDITTFVPIVYLVQQVFIRIDKIQNATNLLSSVLPNATSLRVGMLDLERNQEVVSGAEPFAFDSTIEFKGVSFESDGGKIINDVSLKINKGETIGIIGSSGAGKTTLVDLVLRFIIPTAGEILLDGVNISKVALPEWKKNVIYVEQNAFLRNASIYENINFYDESITQEDVYEAAKKAGIYEYVISLPDKFSTQVGEHGSRHSGGEKQRISIARALARRPKLLILDEATSALDNESELVIKNALHNLRKNTTVVVIAHRLSMITDVDRVLVVDNGQVVEEGKPEDLLNKSDSYLSRISKLGRIES